MTHVPGASAPKPGVLEFDDTSEFVRSITYNPPAPIAPKSEPIIVKIDTRAAPAGEDSDEEIEAITEMDANVHVKEEEEEGEAMDEDETTAMLNAIEDAIKKSEAGPEGETHIAEAQGAAVRIQRRHSIVHIITSSRVTFLADGYSYATNIQPGHGFHPAHLASTGSLAGIHNRDRGSRANPTRPRYLASGIPAPPCNKGARSSEVTKCCGFEGSSPARVGEQTARGG